jgi:hypothetical protein
MTAPDRVPSQRFEHSPMMLRGTVDAIRKAPPKSTTPAGASVRREKWS